MLMRALMTIIECSLRSVTALDFDSQSEELEAIRQRRRLPADIDRKKIGVQNSVGSS